MVKFLLHVHIRELAAFGLAGLCVMTDFAKANVGEGHPPGERLCLEFHEFVECFRTFGHY